MGERRSPRPPSWLRRAPGIRDVPSLAAAALGRSALRRPARQGQGFVSNEAPLIIAGMHRSGTSIVTEVLARAGMYAGGAAVDEHFESVHFSRANRAMTGEGSFLLLDYGWTAPKGGAFVEARRGYAEDAARAPEAFFADRAAEAVWGWKDPRNNLTLPVWCSIYPRAKVLNIIRDGRAVALSLADRDGLDLSFAVGLWAHYLARAEAALASLPQAQKFTVRYEDLIAEPARFLPRVLDFAGLQTQAGIEPLVALLDAGPMAARRADERLRLIGAHPMLTSYGYGASAAPRLPVPARR
jgi:hypothetical protein